MSEHKPIKTVEDWIEYIKCYKRRNGSKLPVAIAVPTKDFQALVNDFKQVCDSNNKRRAKVASINNDYYLKSVVDKVLAEKDTEIASLKACMADMVNTHNRVNDSAMRRERKLKRSLWSMGAMLGKMGSLAYWNIKAKLSAMGDTEGVDWASRKHAQWKNVERKCRQRADWFR